MNKYFLLLSILVCQLVYGQSPDILSIRKFTNEHKGQLINEFTKFLSIPNVAADTAGLHRNAAYVMDMMKSRGIDNVQLLNSSTPGTPPSIYGEVMAKGATKTLIFYAHYDGQPVNPSQWAKELSPFEPKLFNGDIYKGATNIPYPSDGNYDGNWRIYARSAADDKAGVFSILNAFAAIKQSGLPIGYNIKFFFEGEEEKGSIHLNEILENNKALLQSDLWIICDAAIHASGKKIIVLGVRGDAHVNLTVYGSKKPLHSGHYGNWAPNPAMMLAKLLASMKDDNGRVTIKGFYDDVKPLTAAEKKVLQEVPVVDEQLKNEMGIGANEMIGTSLEEARNLPSLNINGMESGNVGKLATNEIPSTATAAIDLRLVLGNDWRRQQQKVIDHIKAQGYYVTDHEPTDDERAKYSKIVKAIPSRSGYNAQRTPLDLPILQQVIAAVKTTTKEQVVIEPTMGGSLPLFIFEQYINGKTVTVPINNYDNNQHAENENIRLQNLFDGIETMASLMMMK